MTQPFRAFDPFTIRAGLAADTAGLLRQLTVLEAVDSTNQFLQQLPLAEQHGHAVVAERQESGRGRRGRRWHSPPGGNIYLSLGWKFPASADFLVQLPLMAAVSVALTMRKAGVATAGIKWPNDIQEGGKKLAGILLEVQSDAAGGMVAVIGVGVNVRMPAGADDVNGIGQPWTDLSAHSSQPIADDFRDRVCGSLLDELLRSLELYARLGFGPFVADWNRFDVLRGKGVTIASGRETTAGKVAGISARGGLLVQFEGLAGSSGLREYLAGEVSVRLS